MTNLKSVRQILIERDKISEEEAETRFQETKTAILQIIMDEGPLADAEDVLADMLGLEPDYLFEFI